MGEAQRTTSSRENSDKMWVLWLEACYDGGEISICRLRVLA